jgi:glycosyltransferase involved in cell wall biosynthesis
MEYKRPLQYVALARELPEARFSMILVRSPNYDEEIEAEVRRQAGELDNFALLDARPRPEAMKLVERSVAVVNTSRLEGMPNVFLEGWARGIPALSLEFDPDERIATRRLGVAAAGDWQRFVDGARELWQRRNDRAELANRCVAYVNSVHSPPVVAEQWSRLFAEL